MINVVWKYLIVAALASLTISGSASSSCPSSIKFIDGNIPFAQDLIANHPYVSPGQLGSSNICWTNGTSQWTQVWVSEEGQPETLFSTHSSATACANAPWIQSDRNYKFTLYEGTNHVTKCDVTYVTGRNFQGPASSGGSSIIYGAMDHNHALTSPGSTSAMDICWQKGNVPVIQIWVREEGTSTDLLFATSGSSNGCKKAPWIRDGTTYGFYLYEGTSHTNALHKAFVSGVSF